MHVACALYKQKMEGVVITSRLLKLSALGEYIEWVDAQQKKICFFFDGKKTGEHTKKEWQYGIGAVGQQCTEAKTMHVVFFA
jgi:hypothetical protein